MWHEFECSAVPFAVSARGRFVVSRLLVEGRTISVNELVVELLQKEVEEKISLGEELLTIVRISGDGNRMKTSTIIVCIFLLTLQSCAFLSYSEPSDCNMRSLYSNRAADFEKLRIMLFAETKIESVGMDHIDSFYLRDGKWRSWITVIDRGSGIREPGIFAKSDVENRTSVTLERWEIYKSLLRQVSCKRAVIRTSTTGKGLQLLIWGGEPWDATSKFFTFHDKRPTLVTASTEADRPSDIPEHPQSRFCALKDGWYIEWFTHGHGVPHRRSQ